MTSPSGREGFARLIHRDVTGVGTVVFFDVAGITTLDRKAGGLDEMAMQQWADHINAAHEKALREAVKEAWETAKKITQEAFKVGVPGAIVGAAVVDIFDREIRKMSEEAPGGH